MRLLARTGGLRTVKGIGERTAKVVEESVAGEEPEYLAALQATAAGRWRAAARRCAPPCVATCTCHSDWSDGGSPIEEMARTAAGLGHEYAALTDHSPRLTVARGLTPQRLRRQLEVVAAALDAELRAASGCSPGSRSTSWRTAVSTRTRSCWRNWTWWCPACTRS